METTPGMQLARYLAKAGVGSRRECERIIKSGEISVNGQRITQPATRVDPDHDKITQSGQRVTPEAKLYFLLHKPAGYTCTAKDPHAEQLAIQLLHLAGSHRVFSVGRLDRDSEGLLLFTNDGDLSNRLLHPRYGITKTYRVIVRGLIRPELLPKLQKGIRDGNETLKAISAKEIRHLPGGAELEITIAEGKKREIRRMCDHIGVKVMRLVRTQFGPIQLGKFRPGYQRNLTPKEIQALKEATNLNQ